MSQIQDEHQDRDPDNLNVGSSSTVAVDEVRRVMLEGVARVCIQSPPEQQHLADLRGSVIAKGLLATRDRVNLRLCNADGEFQSSDAASVAEAFGALFPDLHSPTSRRAVGKAIVSILTADRPLAVREETADMLSSLFGYIENYDGGEVFTEFLDQELSSGQKQH